MVAVHHVETKSDQYDLKNKTRLRQVQQCSSKHGAWLTGELEEEPEPARHGLIFGSMRASEEPTEWF
jgi:hypothetical protein